jgi:hypothetical protein
VYAGMLIYQRRKEEILQKEEEQFCIPARFIVKLRSVADSDFRKCYVSVPVAHTKDE